VQAEVRERVEAALREVPEAFRTVVVLREIEGFAYEEIAEILQVNLGTVKSRLTRGRAVLRGLLAPASLSKPAEPMRRRVAGLPAGSLLRPGLEVSR
jgi:RNA polymerase sigma-70 factor, ECF subfamily